MITSSTDPRCYIQALLQTYIGLPDTPRRPSRSDRQLAAQLAARQIPLSILRTALLLATARRLFRDSSTPLPPVHSLHYFLPVIEEILANPLPSGYAQYLESKISRSMQPTQETGAP